MSYNDFGWGVDQLVSGISRITSPNSDSGFPSTRLLRSYPTGTDLGTTLTITGGSFTVGVDSCGTGTSTCRSDVLTTGPAFAIFDGIVDTLGSISYVNSASPDGDLVLSFSGADPSGLFEVVYYWNRGLYGWARSALVTLSEARAFENTSTADMDDTATPVFSGPSDPSTRIPADNPNGHVVRFTNISPSTTGTFVITVSSDTSETRGKYANALMVQRLQ